MNAIEVAHIKKSYAKVEALCDVSFGVKEGELFGLIGPDGAGKTTLFRILTTLINADEGEAHVMGLDVKKDLAAIRRQVGYMPGKFSLYQDLSVEENMQFFATLFNTTVEENYELVAPIYSQIEMFKTRRAGKLSGGMKQKLALSCALIHKPKVLFLDEPTTGVDAVSRSEFWDMLSLLKKQGITILVCTPYMDEASRCDRIALINEGKILTIDTPTNIVKHHQGRLFSIVASDMYRLLGKARDYQDVLTCYAFGASHHINVNEQFSPTAFSAFVEDKIEIEEIKPSIEDVFMQLMSKNG